MTLVHCKNCGWELRDVDDTPCPNCGDFRRNVSLEGRTQIGLSAKVRTTTSKLEKEIKKNWPLIVVLIVGGIISIIPATIYLTEPLVCENMALFKEYSHVRLDQSRFH